MDSELKRTLKPKLRFPEFRDEPGWEEKSLSTICEVNPRNLGLPEVFAYIDLESVEGGKLVAPKVIRREEAPSRAQRLLQRHDVIYQTVRPYQRNNLYIDLDDKYEYVASTGYAQLRAHDSAAFLFQLIHTDSFVNRVLAQCTGSSYPAIKSSDLAEISSAVPPPPEQRKIAECLSSLDELIDAEGRKLEALRTHKKGLMQNLFPRPGETRPRYRFPEFQNAQEWTTRPLGDLLLRRPEYGANAAAVPFSEELPTYLRITDINDDGRIIVENKVSLDIDATERNYLQEGDIVLARTGASVGKSYRYRPEDGRLVFAGFLIRIKPNPKKLSSTFLSHFFSTRQYWDWVLVTSARSGQPGINGNEYSSLPIPIPPKNPDSNELSEQIQISDCLLSLDEQITATIRRINSLKAHKKGLMQQLFPSPEEAEA